MLHEVGHDDGGTPGDAHFAMDQDASIGPVVGYPLVGLREKAKQVLVRCVPYFYKLVRELTFKLRDQFFLRMLNRQNSIDPSSPQIFLVQHALIASQI